MSFLPNEEWYKNIFENCKTKKEVEEPFREIQKEKKKAKKALKEAEILLKIYPNGLF